MNNSPAKDSQTMKQANASHTPGSPHASMPATGAAHSLHVSVLALSLTAALVFTGCGGEQKAQGHAGHNHAHDTSHAHQPAAVAAANALAVAEDGKVTIESGDNMRYNLTEFVVRPGQSVELTLRHTGRMPVSAMGHNIVLLKKYTDVRAFVQASARSASTDYIPRSMASQVIAHTKMLGGGESDTITFTAPSAPGEYDFICSFPAHLGAGMQGKMIVRKE